MQFSSKPSTEDKLAAMRKKARLALKEKDNEQQKRFAHMAKLKAQRLARDAELEAVAAASDSKKK